MSGYCVRISKHYTILMCKCNGKIRQGRIDSTKFYCDKCNKYFTTKEIKKMIIKQGGNEQDIKWMGLN